MSDDCECPYCGKPVEICHDDGQGYAEDEQHQQECGECEKTFVFTTSIHYYYHPEKADCLNGGEHRWKQRMTIPDDLIRDYCEDCGKETPWRQNPKPSYPLRNVLPATPATP